jgi:putative acetyltransferase
LAPLDLTERFEAYIARALAEEIERIPEYYFADSGRGFWVAEDRNEIVGYFGIEVAGPSCCELRRMYVVSDRRRRGIGKALLSEAERQCLALGAEKIVLNTSELQQAAIRLYESAGYRQVREMQAMEMTNKTVGGGIRRFVFEKMLSDPQRASF